MRSLLIAFLLFGLGVVVGTAGSDDTLLQEAHRKEVRAYNQGVADATLRFQTIAVQSGHASWVVDDGSSKPDRFVWKSVDGGDMAGSEETRFFLVPAPAVPSSEQPFGRIPVPVRNSSDSFAPGMMPTAG